MGRLLSTLGLVVVLAGLAGYIYFIDSERPAGDVEVKTKAFGEVASDDIEEIAIKSAEGETSRLRRTDGTWRLTEPVAVEADQSEISSITSSAASLEIQRVVDEQATDLKQYGLDPARIEMSFTAKGQPARRILLGEKTPTGTEVYAKLPDQPKVFLVSSFLESTFNKNTLALRDKTALKFDNAAVDGFEVVSGTTTLQFAKKGSEWSIVKPIAARADLSAVEGAIARLGSVQMQGITAEQAGDLKQYGLDAPTASMTVVSGSNRAALTLGKTENAVVFAKDATRPMVFTVAPTLHTDVIKPVGDFRRKDLFDFRAFTATRIELRRGTETLTFEKSTTKGAAAKDGAAAKEDSVVWKNAAGKDVDAMKIDDLLTKVSNLRAQSFEDKAHPSLSSPVLTVVATFGSASQTSGSQTSSETGGPQSSASQSGTETVTIGRAGADVFASRSGEPGAARVEAMLLDEALKALDAAK